MQLRKLRPNPGYVPHLRPSPSFIIDVRVMVGLLHLRHEFNGFISSYFLQKHIPKTLLPLCAPNSSTRQRTKSDVQWMWWRYVIRLLVCLLFFLTIEEYSGHLKRVVSWLGQQAESSRFGMALPSISRLSSKHMIQPFVPWPSLTLVPTLHLQIRVVSSSISSPTWTTLLHGKAHRHERPSEGWVSVQTIDVLRLPVMIQVCGYGHLQKVEWRAC